MGVSRYERGATIHGTRRIRERMKLPARAVKRLVDKARAEGLPFDHMPGWLQIAVDHKRTLHATGADYAYFRGFLFVFQPGWGDLITTYPINEEEPEDASIDWEYIRRTRNFFD